MASFGKLRVLGARSTQMAAKALNAQSSRFKTTLATSSCLHMQMKPERWNSTQFCAFKQPSYGRLTGIYSYNVQPSRKMSTDATGSRDLMDFPHILFPSFVKMAKNLFLSWFIIRPYLDHGFSFQTFLDGAKEAVLVVSERVSRGDFAGLRDLVTPEALAEIERNYAALSVKERCALRIERDHIGPIFPYEIGMIIEEEGDVQKRWVEITVCAHVHPNFSHRDQLSETPYIPPYHLQDFTVCNYRFIRNYTKGVRDSWTVNVVNHFKPNKDQDKDS